MKKQFLFLSLLILFLVIVGLYRSSKEVTNVNNKRVYDSINKTIALLVKDVKEQSLTISLSLSSNSDITDSIKNNNHQKAHLVLKEATKHLKEYLQKKEIYAQIITKDYTIFARSWEKDLSQPKLKSYRVNLDTLLEPYTDFDVTRLLSIKSTTPIYDGKNIIGFLEITCLLDNIVEKLRDLYSIELVPLMDRRFEDIASFTKNNTKVSQYVVGSKNTNKNIVHKLRRFNEKDLTKLTKGGVLQRGSVIFLSYPIRDRLNERLGEFIATISSREREAYLKDDNHFLKQIFTINATQDDIFKKVNIEDNRVYNNLDLTLLLKLHQQQENIDKSPLQESIKEKLSTLDKEELVDIILNRDTKKTITGEIR